MTTPNDPAAGRDVDDPAGTRDAAASQAALAALVEVAARLVAAPALTPVAGSPVLTAVAEAAAAILGAEAASIAVHDPIAERLTFVAAGGPQGAGVIGLSIDATSGLAGYALTTGQALAVADVQTDARFDRATAESTGFVPRSILAVPLTDEEGTVGVLEVLDGRDGRSFDLRDIDTALALAGPATAAVRAGELERDGIALLRSVLAGVADGGLDAAAIDGLVASTSAGLDAADDGVRWRLADRIARLRDADPESLELAIDWLDVLIRHGRSSRR